MGFAKLPIPPGGTNRMHRTGNGFTYTPKPVKAWRQSADAILARYEPQHGDFGVIVAYHPKARKKASESPLRRLDVDGPLKPVLDVLQGRVYHDDRQVVLAAVILCEPVAGGAVRVVWGQLGDE